jgi:hypothetical protein
MKETKPSDDQLKVFIINTVSKCDDCREGLGHHAWIVPQENKGVLCLTCADLDHLVFLPAGDAALTRRSRKYSKLSAVVLKWSRARKRYERQGLLVENEAIERAEQECATDAPQRKLRQARASVRRAELDQEYIKTFASKVRKMYPHCPTGRETEIAEHACRKYSGRVGRCAMAKDLDAKAVHLAVTAHIRHTETNYDDLLGVCNHRQTARAQVIEKVNSVLRLWAK